MTGFEAFGTPDLDREKGVIRSTASINTATLEAGDYTLMAVLPNYQTRRIPHLEKRFTVLPASPEAEGSQRPTHQGSNQGRVAQIAE